MGDAGDGGGPNEFAAAAASIAMPPAPPSASDLYAALTREQWQNYVSTFVPIENQLIQFATDPNKPLEAMAEASRDVNAAYAAQQGSMQRRLSGLGVSLTADEQAAQQRSFGLSKSLADVGAQNVAGALTRQRQQSVLGNPAPTPTGE
jgi:hypothetical protein